jgi:hypothetical protein
VAYKVFTNGSVLNASEINLNLMNQSVMVFTNSTARSAALTSPSAGMVTYLSGTNVYESYNGTSWVSFGSASLIPINFLVIAGGGGGGQADGGFVAGGGGGAGGYRNSHGTSGGNSSAESTFGIILATNYPVTVGAGGAANTNGSNSNFSAILSYGGCKGARTTAINSQPGVGGSGGGGQGATYSAIVGFAVPFQGVNGSTGYVNTGMNQGGGGGGGGASATGGAAGLAAGGTGGSGLASTITGSSVTRAGGGGGGAGNTTGAAAGGAGGGGAGGGSPTPNAVAGTVNTGGGGGGGQKDIAGAAGGSGLVILRYANTYTITLGAGLTGSTATDGSSKVTTITAGTGNVSWA